MLIHRLATLAAAAVLLSAPLRAHALAVGQGEFNPADWSQITQLQNGVGSVVFSVQDDADGNPGSHWQHVYTRPRTFGTDTSQARVANINRLFVYDPGTAGALDSIDFSIDLRGVSNSFAFATTGFFRPVILQDDRIYGVTGSFRSADLGQWNSFAWSFDAASDWQPATGSGGPDFSSAGSRLSFGYQFSLSTSCSGSAGCFGGTAVSALDNFELTLHPAAVPVPEPQTHALVLAGLGVLAWSRRRKRA
jgi:hypothetical protein